MRGPIITSTIFHIAVVLIAWFGLPSFNRSLDLPPPPVEVEMITEDELAELTTRPEVQQPTKTPPPPPPPPPPPTPPPPPPTPPEPELEPETEAEIIPEKVKLPEKPKVKPKPPEKPKQVAEMRPTAKPPEPKKKPEKKEEKKKDFSSVLKTVQKLKDQPTPRPVQKEKDKKKEEPKKLALADILKNAQKKKDSQPRREISEASSLLSNSELDAVKQQIAGCWNIQPGARDADNLVVRLRVVMNQDMSVRSVKIVDKGESSNPFWSAAARSAQAAVLKCSPLNLPHNKYDVWGVINFTFDPKQMFG